VRIKRAFSKKRGVCSQSILRTFAPRHFFPFNGIYALFASSSDTPLEIPGESGNTIYGCFLFLREKSYFVFAKVF